jgi:hypothetical protein
VSLSEKQIIHAQAVVIKHMRDTIVLTKARCEDHINWANENKLKPSKLALDLSHRLQIELEYLDVQGALVDEASRRKIPKNQEKIDTV